MERLTKPDATGDNTLSVEQVSDYDFIVWKHNKPGRGRIIVARFTSQSDAELFIKAKKNQVA